VLASLKLTRTYSLSDTSGIRQRLKTGWDLPVVAFFHDQDIVGNSNFLASYLYSLEAPGSLTENPVQHYLSQDEFIAYMHAQVSTANLKFTFDYDSHYCKKFSNYSSSWTLQLADYLLTKLRGMGKILITTDNITITANSATYFNQTMTLKVPKGTGTHKIQFAQYTSEPTYISVNLDNSMVALGSKVTVTGTLLNINGTGIGNAAIILSCSFQGYKQPLTWALTNPNGNFAVSWIPQASGQFTVEAYWKGNETYEAASNSTVLTVTP
jgi:hypothetical protein